jgi:hypothetical protein
MDRTFSRGALAVACALVAGGMLTACGSSSSSSGSAGTATGAQKPPAAGTSSGAGTSAPPVSAFTITESGKSAGFSGPTKIQGGIVQLRLTNQGKQPHGLQFGLLEGGHTAAQALAVLGGSSNKTPSWLRAEGGVSVVAPGQTGTATVDLPVGKYFAVDLASLGGGGGGPPAVTSVTVAGSGSGQSLPATSATVTAANPANDRYDWQISGLHAGLNQITFASKGKEALHLISAVRLKGNPPLSQIEKALSSNGPPPAFVDSSVSAQSAALDGGKSQVATLNLPPGEYVFFCPLHDRDGGKAHFAEGLIKKVKIS